MNTDIHKESWLRSIIKHGKWYILSSIFAKGINIILLPVYTRYLSPDEYGILNSLNAVAQLLPIFISLYLDSAFGRFFHDVKQDHEKLKTLFSSVFWFVVLNGAAVVIITILSSYFWLQGLLKVPVWPYAFLAFIPPLMLQLGQLGIIFLRQSLKAKQTTFIEISTTLITIAVTIPLLVGFHLGVIARLWGGVAGGIFIAVFYTVYFYRNGLLVLFIDKQTLINCLKYSIPLIPNIACGWIAGLSDRLVLAKFKTLEAVGIYSLAYQFAMIMYIVQDAITQVQSPLSMSGLIYDREATKEKIAKFILFLFSGMLLCHLCLVLFSKEVIVLFTTKSYYQAYKLIGIIGFMYVMSSLYRVFTDIIAFHKKTWIISMGAILMAVIGLGLNLLLVPKYGYYASSVAANVSMLSYFLVLFLNSQKLDKIKLYWKESFLVLFVYAGGLFVSYQYLMGNISVQNIALKLLLISAVGIALGYFTYGKFYGFVNLRRKIW